MPQRKAFDGPANPRPDGTPPVKLAIVAIGRLARSPETELVKTYVERATNAGRALGLGPVEVVEVESRKPGKAAEAEALQPHLADAHVIACDEHGQARPSRAFADEIAAPARPRRAAAGVPDRRRRRPGRRRCWPQANGKLAFGPQTWPHALARAMLAEQVYRAVTILAGSPYHRD